MTRSCEFCGDELAAHKRADARFCTSACKAAQHREKGRPTPKPSSDRVGVQRRHRRDVRLSYTKAVAAVADAIAAGRPSEDYITVARDILAPALPPRLKETDVDTP